MSQLRSESGIHTTWASVLVQLWFINLRVCKMLDTSNLSLRSSVNTLICLHIIILFYFFMKKLPVSEVLV